MLGRPRVSVVVAACLVTTLLPLSSAWASSTASPDGTLDPTTSTPSAEPSPSSISPTPAPGPGGNGAIGGGPDPLESSSRDVITVPGSASPSPSATETVPVRRDADGVAPAAGQVDEYLRLSEQQHALVQEVADKRSLVTAADLAIGPAADDARRATLDASVAQLDQRSSDRTVDDVVRELYQNGDTGLASIASILTSGPDGFVDRISSFEQARAVSNGVVRTAEQAQLQLDVAQVTASSAVSRLRAAVLARAAAQAAYDGAKSRLGDVEEQMTRLGAVAPQVAVGPEGCPTADVPATLRDGADVLGANALCRFAVKNAATPQAALAITWAFQRLGAAYACGGAGRMLPFRADCSSLVSRAYAEGAGLRTAGDGWAPSTRDMVPWDGVALDPHYAYVAPQALRPGDLVLYDTCPQGGCPYKHVVMYLGSPDGKSAWMLHTNACGDVAKVEAFWGFPTSGSHTFLVSRRVVALPGETVTSGVAVASDAPAAPKSDKKSRATGATG